MVVADGDEYIHIKIHLAGEEWKENGSTSSVQLARNGSFIFYFTQSLCQCNSVGGLVWAEADEWRWVVGQSLSPASASATNASPACNQWTVSSVVATLGLRSSRIHTYIRVSVLLSVSCVHFKDCGIIYSWWPTWMAGDGGCELNRPPHFCNAGKSILELFFSAGFRFNHHCSRRGTKCSFFHKKCIL